MRINEFEIVADLEVKSKDICAILVHPYALLGGSMNDYVIQHVKKLCLKNNVSTLTFNLKPGYGYNSIQTDVHDLLGLTDIMRKKYQFKKFIYIGYSYGSIITCEASKQVEPLALISISYPAGVLWFLSCFNTMYFKKELQKSSKSKKLFVIGTEDHFTSVKNWKGFLEGVDANFVVFEEVGHFYQRDGELEQLLCCLDEFLNTNLKDI